MISREELKTSIKEVDVELMIKKIIGRKDGIKITVEVNVEKRH